MLIGADGVPQMLYSYRLCWIRGKFGGGKTVLAFELAQWFLDRGYKLITNTPCVWADPIDSLTLDDTGRVKAVIIADEGGRYFKRGKQIEEILAYARKMDICLIIPSFISPAPMAREFSLQPLASLRGAGIPLIDYEWYVDSGGYKAKGKFASILGFKTASLGVYDTLSPGDSLGKIVRALVRCKDDYKRMYGASDDDIYDELPEMESAREIIEAAEAIEYAAGKIATIPIPDNGRKSRRGRN